MADFILSCCATADLAKSHMDSRSISYASPPYFLDGKEYRDDLFQSMAASDFYQAMVDGADTKTSQPNMEEFIQYFEKLLEQGKDILHISLSSGLSGTFNSATNALTSGVGDGTWYGTSVLSMSSTKPSIPRAFSAGISKSPKPCI